MLTTNERTDVFLEVLQRLAPEIRSNATPYSRPGDSLQGILERLGPVPRYSALIGLCEDGLPFLLDLQDPSAGSILVVGEDDNSPARLIQTILSSASALNPPEDVRFTVLSADPGVFAGLESIDNCRAVLSVYDRLASELVVEMAELAEQRRYGRNMVEIEILAIDDLAALVQNNDYEVNAYLKWLVENGPRSSIWPVAAIQSTQLWRIRDGLSEAFKTLLAAPASPRLTQGTPGVFTVCLDGESISFRVPEF